MNKCYLPLCCNILGRTAFFIAALNVGGIRFVSPSSSLKLNMPLKMYDCGNNIDSAHTVNNLQPGCTVL